MVPRLVVLKFVFVYREFRRHVSSAHSELIIRPISLFKIIGSSYIVLKEVFIKKFGLDKEELCKEKEDLIFWNSFYFLGAKKLDS